MFAFDTHRRTHPDEAQFYYLGGSAGTGKTYTLTEGIKDSDLRVLLCASTGVAGINLGGQTTVNQILGYFDYESLAASYGEGHLATKLNAIHKKYDWIVIDECGMISNKIGKIIYDALMEHNHSHDSTRGPLGILFVGDFCQLPPIAEKSSRETPWLFKEPAVHSAFALPGHTEILTKIWRQTDENYLKALDQLRRGNGAQGVAYLKKAGAEFHPRIDINFPGTTIVSTNVEADRFNNVYLNDLSGNLVKIPSFRWHVHKNPPAAWKNIPEHLDLKLGAYVMILANYVDPLLGPLYSNGDCGTVEEIIQTPNVKTPHHWSLPFTDIQDINYSVKIRLKRNNQLVSIGYLVRGLEAPEAPEEPHERSPRDSEGNPCAVPKKPSGSCWLHGQIRYMPIRIAKYSTVHKSQGLTLDAVQIDATNHFFSHPAMVYVAVSRCREAKNLRIIGSPQNLSIKTRIAPEIKQYL